MCGIAGVIDFSKNAVDMEKLRRMTRTLERRGPDEEGYWSELGAGIGHRRLSVIDIAGGKQPMVSADDRFVISYNGEVYSFPEIRKDLESRGFRFRTSCDTEAVLELIAREWSAGVSKLWGQFALAVWDRKERRLLLARDRLGQKPLFYCRKGGKFYFASEMKAILEGLDQTPDIDETALYNAFLFNAVPPDESLFLGMRSLPSGAWMEISEQGERKERYWTVKHEVKKRSFAEAKDEFLSLFEDAVERRLVSDVPLGAFLSGGIDSGLVVAAMTRRCRSRVRTFCAVCKGDDDPDVVYARRLAKKLGVEHTEIVLDPMGADSWATYCDMVYRFEAPYSLGSIVLLYFVMCRETRRHVTVVLDGSAGDELFAGYTSYPLYRRLDLARKFIPFRTAGDFSDPRWLAFLTGPAESIQARMYRDRVVGLSKIFDSGFFNRADSTRAARRQGEIFSEVSGGCLLSGALLTDLLYNHHHNVSMLADRAGLGNSLEIRSPFIDHRLVEFAASLPGAWKAGLWRETRVFLKQALRGYLPDENLDRKKLGFGHETSLVVFKLWEPRLRRMFESGPLPPMLSRAGVKEALELALRTESASWTCALWFALGVTLWWTKFVRKDEMPE